MVGASIHYIAMPESFENDLKIFEVLLGVDCKEI